MSREVAGYLLDQRAFADALSSIWHGRSSADEARLATLRVFEIPEDGGFAGPLYAFRQDVEAATDLTHEHLVQTWDVGRRGDHTYVIGPHTPAVPLSDHLRGQTLRADQALDLLGPLAGALDAAAAADLAHGAVHPRSIWIAPAPAQDGAERALLSGFGLHHLLRVLAVHRRDGDVVEDFLYVAPELLRGGRPTNRSDQYALAGAFLHAITGRPPFERDGMAALLGAHLFARPPMVERGDPATGALADIIVRGLAKNPDDRFERCQELVAAVRRWCHATGAAASVDTSPEDVGPVPVAPPEVAAPAAATETAVPRRQGAAPAPAPSAVTPTQPRRRRTVRSRARVLAAAGAIVGMVAVVGIVALLSSTGPQPSVASVTAAPSVAPVSDLPPGLRWRQRLPAPVSELYVASAGVVAVTAEQALVLDPDTGRVRGEIVGGQAVTTVTNDGGLVTSGVDGLRMLDIEDGTVQWHSEITGVRPPAEADGTLYGVSDASVPQLIATDARSGQRLWQFPEEERAFPADTAVAPADDFVYLADTEAVYGILPEGASFSEDTTVIEAGDRAPEPLCVWRTEVDEDLWSSSLLAVDDGVVVADQSGDVCLRRHADGAPVWCEAVSGVVDAEPSVLAAGDQVFVVTPDAVTAIDVGTGTHLWTREGQWRDVALDEERLVAVDADGAVAVVSTSTGDVHRLADVTVSSSAVLAVDGDVLYAAHEDGGLVSADLAQLSDG